MTTKSNNPSAATGVIALLQARMSSSRLPGKVLKNIMGQPMLALQIARINAAKNIDKLVVVTSNDASDDPIASLCNTLHINCFRGSLPDVLDRFYQASRQYHCQHIIRLTGDCPLIDAGIIDEVITLHLNSDADYTTNSILPDDKINTLTYPDGTDVEVIKSSVLAQLWQNTHKAYYREHVTSFIRSHPDNFNISYLHHPEDLSMHRWTVDEPEDFVFVDAIFSALYANNHAFSYHDILAHLQQNPELMKINYHLRHP